MTKTGGRAETVELRIPKLRKGSDSLAAYNYARRLKTLGRLMPYEYICKIWISERDRFILDPIHQMRD